MSGKKKNAKNETGKVANGKKTENIESNTTDKVAENTEEKIKSNGTNQAAEEAERGLASCNGTTDEADLAIVLEVLQKFELNNPTFTTEGKLNAVCLMLSEAIKEGTKLKEESRNLHQQLEKESQTKEAQQKLIAALRTQIALTREEGELKLKEETQKRVECSQQFQSTVSELSELMEKHTGHNSKLRAENAALAEKMSLIMAQYEQTEERVKARTTEYQLQVQLYEAKLNKAQIERAEANAEFTRERLQMHKQLLESRADADKQLHAQAQLKDELEEARDKCLALEKDAGDQDNKGDFNNFRAQMDKVGRKLRQTERDVSDWREKYESSNDQVKKMNAASLEREQQLEQASKKLEAMEKLNRAMQQERAGMIKKIKQINKVQEVGEEINEVKEEAN